ncbi:hypothetical protein PHYBOEH_007869 [Phytophthora boehmeriae]|uniref:RxLR effector protein n=1 Tax=Phytophthora boehmeriae TaxID=109152 RepID=A0A8T1W9N8_9STRA|nr:hypothetical protein PHYBOEH_007869 [Phytophthora boehmeriae]
MRVGYIVLATTASLLATGAALPAANEVAHQNTFTTTSTDSKSALRGLSTKLYDDDTKATDFDDQEERALPVNPDAVQKLTKTASQKLTKAASQNNYNSPINKFLWHLFRKMTPKNYRTN